MWQAFVTGTESVAKCPHVIIALMASSMASSVESLPTVSASPARVSCARNANESIATHVTKAARIVFSLAPNVKQTCVILANPNASFARWCHPIRECAWRVPSTNKDATTCNGTNMGRMENMVLVFGAEMLR